MLVAEDAPTGREDHRSVSLDEGREGRFLDLRVPPPEFVEELTVGQADLRS